MEFRKNELVEVRPWNELVEEYGLDGEGELDCPNCFDKAKHNILDGKCLFIEEIDTDETVKVTGMSMLPMWIPKCVLKKFEIPNYNKPVETAPAEGTSAAQEHYKKSAMQPVQVMQMLLSPEQFKGFLLGNVIKYLMRAPFKGQRGADYGKARQYYYWHSLVKNDPARRISPVSDVPPTGFCIEGILG